MIFVIFNINHCFVALRFGLFTDKHQRVYFIHFNNQFDSLITDLPPQAPLLLWASSILS